jgi:hypothetical protein
MNEIEFKLTVIERLSKIEEHTKNNSATFQKHLAQDETIAADVAKKLSSIEVILDRNTASLELHMKRTDLLEKQLETRVSPIESHVKELRGGIKLIKGVVWVASAISVIVAVIQLFAK